MTNSKLSNMISSVLGVEEAPKSEKAAKTVKAGKAKQTATQILTAKFTKCEDKGVDIAKMVESAYNAKPKREGIEQVAQKLNERYDEKAVTEYLEGIKSGKPTVRSHFGWLLQGYVPTETRLIAMSKGVRGTYSLWHKSQCVKTNTQKEIKSVIEQFGANKTVEAPKKPRKSAKKVEEPSKDETIQALKAQMAQMAEVLAKLA